jgi:hypothetical protein
MKLGPLTIPFLGGTYLRLLPAAVRRRGVRKAHSETVLWTYCHPWEFDPDEKFYVYEHGGWLISRVGWLNRKHMLKRVEATLRTGVGRPLGELATTLVDLPIFDPTQKTNEPETGSV